MKAPSLSKLLDKAQFPSLDGSTKPAKQLEPLQMKLLKIQQGLFHSRQRAILAVEGFDAAGKGGVIRRLTERIDPRGVHVVPIGPPKPDEQGRHYLWRFWHELPPPGVITVFDRTWYGRVLVERIDGLCPKSAWKRAYREINEFERMLVDDGIDLIKLFLAVSKDEQLARFEKRLKDPAKHWKIGEADVKARAHWDDYVQATDELFQRTHTRRAPWHLVPADDKGYARVHTLERVTEKLWHHGKWLEDQTPKRERSELRKELARLQ